MKAFCWVSMGLVSARDQILSVQLKFTEPLLRITNVIILWYIYFCI